MYDSRNNLSNQVVADVREFMGRKVYDTMIPRNVRVSEAPSYGKPVLIYDLKCVGSEAYLRLATEVIQREKELKASDSACASAKFRGAINKKRERVRNSGAAAMADEAARSRLGRGLAALIGDVGDETPIADASANRAQAADRIHRGPIRAIRAAPLPTANWKSLPRPSASAASFSRSWCARCAAPTTLRDHRRRAALARGAARRSARSAGRCARSDRRAIARTRHHRERAARGSQCAGRGGRLSGARRTNSNTARTTSRRSSARAAAMSPIRCGC